MRLVLLTIADAANRDGENARPGMRAMVEGSLYSQGHVRRTLTRLVDDGWIQVEERGGGEAHESVFRVCADRREVAHHARLRESDTSDNEDGKSRGSRAEVARKSRVWTRDNADTTLLIGITDTETCDASNEASATTSSTKSLEDARRLCDLLADQIASRGCKRPSVTKEWAADMDKLMRLDHRTPEQVEAVLNWLAGGRDKVARFWQPNVRCPAKLRERWDHMAEQWRKEVRKDDRERTAPTKRVEDMTEAEFWSYHDALEDEQDRMFATHCRIQARNEARVLVEANGAAGRS